MESLALSTLQSYNSRQILPRAILLGEQFVQLTSIRILIITKILCPQSQNSAHFHSKKWSLLPDIITTCWNRYSFISEIIFWRHNFEMVKCILNYYNENRRNVKYFVRYHEKVISFLSVITYTSFRNGEFLQMLITLEKLFPKIPLVWKTIEKKNE